jgi:hypothetical protein
VLEFIDQTVIPFFLDLYDALGYVGVAVGVALETFIPIIPSEISSHGRLEDLSRRRSHCHRQTDALLTFIGVMVAALCALGPAGHPSAPGWRLPGPTAATSISSR